MLGSISPFGERARGQRWWLTFAAYGVASAAAGLLLGGVLGLAGSAALPSSRVGSTPRLAILAAVLLAGALVESGTLGRPLPTTHRQVSEEWLHRYRGWVYGAGFGFQLGLGVATIVSTPAVYATFLTALVSGSAGAGAAVGAAFGLLRASSLLLVLPARDTARLYRVDGLLRRWDRPATRTAAAVQLALGAVAAGLAL